jgi:DNA-binding response OmpR family regulator
MRLERRILVIDDDDAIRALLMTVLRRRGYVVESARNGAEGLEKLALCRYALIVLDVMMPVMNGYDVLEQLGEMSAASRPMVLLLTAGATPRRYDSSLVVGTMAKPFDIELLVNTISGCLEVAPAREQLDRCPEATVPADRIRDEIN